MATRRRLIECARAVAIRTDGHIEVAAVAAAAGVAPSLIPRYFGSKTGLVRAVVDDFFDRYHAAVLDISLGGDWATSERARLRMGVDFHYTDPFAVVLYGQLSRDPEVARTESARIDTVIGHAATSVRRAQRRGELPTSVDPQLAGAAMFGAMRQVMIVALRRTPHPPRAPLTTVLWRQVAASVAIDPTTGRPTL